MWVMGSICKFHMITTLLYCLFCEGGRGVCPRVLSSWGGFCPGVMSYTHSELSCGLCTEFLTELRRFTYANCASHLRTVDYAPNQETTSVLHGLVSDLLTKLSPSQRHLPGTHCQLTFVTVVARQHSRNISRLSSFKQLLICINILLFYFLFYSICCLCVLYCTALLNIG